MNQAFSMNRWHKWLSYLTDIQIDTKHSEISGPIYIKWRNGKRVVDTETVNYAYGTLYEVFQQAFVKYDVQHKVKPKKILLLGFGAGSVFQLVRETFGREPEIVGVERDPIMLQIYRDYFLHSDANLTLIQADVQTYIQESTEKFDLILIDVFVGEHVPNTLFQESFVQFARNALSQSGVLMWNVIVEDADQKSKFDLLTTFFSPSLTWFVLNRVNRMIIWKNDF